MKFNIPKDGKINPEPPGLMVVKDNATAAQYTELFPEWTVISVTKITAKSLANYAELFAEYQRIVFWHPSGYIKDVNKRYEVLQALCACPTSQKIEVYGFHGSGRYPRDTVAQAMIYLPCLLPNVEFPASQMTYHTVYEWRRSRRSPKHAQVPVSVWSNTPENMNLIKSVIND